MDLFPGCIIVESGTGSGCFTVSMARAVYPSGHIYTYEYNQIRAEQAKEEFKRY
jgi:tRNA (adenine57-N1/adenine58-N1)-methyltransferase